MQGMTSRQHPEPVFAHPSVMVRFQCPSCWHHPSFDSLGLYDFHRKTHKKKNQHAGVSVVFQPIG